MDKNSIIEKLRRIDDRLSIEYGVTLEDGVGIIVVGGGAIALASSADERVTKDIDILSSSPDYRSIIFEDPDINDACNAFSLNVPYHYQDRLVEIPCLDFHALHVYRPSLEDLAVMKLYRWENPDKEDLLADSVLQSMNWDALRCAVDDAWLSRIAEDKKKDLAYTQMVFNYHQYLALAGEEQSANGFFDDLP